MTILLTFSSFVHLYNNTTHLLQLFLFYYVNFHTKKKVKKEKPKKQVVDCEYFLSTLHVALLLW